MGHKVNPIGLRVGINRTWDSRWFASRGEYGKLLHEDMHIRDHILKQRRQAGISKVVIERPHKKCRVTVHTARPGVLIGKKGADIEKLRGELAQADRLGGASQHRRGAQARDRRHAGGRDHRPAARAPRRLPPRHEARGAVGAAAGRARHPHQLLAAVSAAPRSRASEWYREGRVPLHTLRADIDFGYGLAQDGLRRHRRQGVDLQGRDHGARSDGRREARASRRRRRGGGGRRRRRRRCAASAMAAGPAAERQRRAGRRPEERATMLQPTRTKYRKAFKGRIHGNAKGGTDAELRLARPQGRGARARHGAPDRGGAAGHHARHEARGPRLDPHLPGRAGDEEAGRSAHGLRQGRARAVGGPRQAGPHHVRARRRERARPRARRSSSVRRSCRSRRASSGGRPEARTERERARGES